MNRRPESALLLLLAAVQFTHIMDFMIMMPLGPQLMRDLAVGPSTFSALVSAYTLSAGIIGLVAATFVDRYDRRPLLLITYAGFALGTLACAMSHSANTLMLSRVICGAFGGVSGSLVMAIVSDIVPPERRAHGLGIVMTAFSVAAAIGIPAGLWLAQRFDWEAPFFLLAALSAIMWIVLWKALPSVREHLRTKTGEKLHPFRDLLRDANAGRALLFMSAMIFGHFTVIPFLSPYLVGNVGLPERHLFLVYFVGGVVTVIVSPKIGTLADRFGRHRTFGLLVFVACAVTLWLTHAGPLPLWAVLVMAALFFGFASGRFVPGQAIVSLAVPRSHRGSFMSLVSCVRDITAGVASGVGGWVVQTGPDHRITGYAWLGWAAVAASLLSIWLAGRVKVQDHDRAIVLGEA